MLSWAARPKLVGTKLCQPLDFVPCTRPAMVAYRMADHQGSTRKQIVQAKLGAELRAGG